MPGPDRAQSTGPGFDVDSHSDATFDDFSEDSATPGTAPSTALGQEGNKLLHGDSNNSSSDESDDLALEIWTSSDEDCQNINSAGAAVTQVQHGRMISYVLSYFLLFFQLCYHMSDRGLQHILTLISSILYWLSKVVTGSGKDALVQISSNFPRTIYSLEKAFGVKKTLTYYCVCTVCHSLYKEEDCIVSGPRNSQFTYRRKCGTELMKCVKVSNKYKLVPRKRFVYNSTTNSIRQFASRPGFLDSCLAWRKEQLTDGSFMMDIYDGKLWKEWKKYLDIPGNLMLMINVDWFRPFKHVPYSIGVIYLVILNLPRKIRFKPENIIIIGAIPGPREPKLTIKSYLKPMVDEMLVLWEGISIESPRSVLGAQTVRVALCCICSDIPATRKLCGFYGFKARHGCSKCLKEFPTSNFSDGTDYSGFQREVWQPRDMDLHYKKAMEAKDADSNAERTKIERDIGVRYSELLRLPYLNIVRCHLIHPMHNLFLGTA